MNRLRVQLILAFTLVVLVAVGAIAVLFVRTTHTQFRRYITNSGMRASGSGLQLRQRRRESVPTDGGW